MTSDSNRHAQRGDAKQAPSEGCQSGPKGIAQMTSPRDRVEETELDANGEAMMCEGCGTTRTLAAILARHGPKAIACCPERKMIQARHFWDRALGNTRQSPEVVTDEMVEAAWHAHREQLGLCRSPFIRHRGDCRELYIAIFEAMRDAALLKVSP